MQKTLNSIPEAIEDIKAGKLIIVVDDEDRENEGDFLTAARNVTPEIINFMATHGRGLICAPLIEDRCDELGLDLMVKNNTVLHETPFTVSIDLKGHGCTTGISASDRAKTVQALINPDTKPEDFGKPGHIFPLRAKKGGVLRRTGHTEATIDLARLAGFEPAGVLVEIMNEDGTMARLPELFVIAEKFDLKIISIKDLIAYRLEKESLIERKAKVKMPTDKGNFDLIAYKQVNTGEEHVALVKGTWEKDEPVLVRVHSSCLTGDVFGSVRCDCKAQLTNALEQIAKNKHGYLIYLKGHEGRGIGIGKKIAAYALQDNGENTFQANLSLGLPEDARNYQDAIAILKHMHVNQFSFITNNPDKVAAIQDAGFQFEQIIVPPFVTEQNKKYLQDKATIANHKITF